jgi:hypothetical protein
MSAATTMVPAVDAPSMAAQYERLRRAGLGEPLPPDARCGLLLFLRRGMWAWTQALATATRAPLAPQDSPASVSRASDVTGVIQVFAAIALASPHRSAP